MIRTNLGAVTAYAYAVDHDYTGTEEQFGDEMANIANNSARLSTLESAVDTLDEAVNGLSNEVDTLYPADTTLSVSSKAADAKTVGDQLELHMKSAPSFTGNDVDDLLINGFSYVSSGTAHLPTSTGGYYVETVIFNGNNTASAIQNAYNFNSGKRYYRLRRNSIWEDWLLIGENLYSLPVFDGTDVNSIVSNSIMFVPAGVSNLPTASDGYFVETILYGGNDTRAAMQNAYQFSTGLRFYRRKSNNAWGSWKDLSFTYIESKLTYAGSDANDILNNSFMYVSSSVSNMPPLDGGYFVETVLLDGTNTGAAIQKAHHFTTGSLFYRRRINNAWDNWIPIGTPVTSPVYYAYGDSLMWGAVWERTTTSPYYNIVRLPLFDQIPARIARAIGSLYSFKNRAIGGAYFVGDGDNKIIDQLRNQSITDVNIITMAGGRNDSSNPLGDKNSTVGDGTICGAIKEIIQYIQTNAPKAQIVWIGVTPNTDDNSTVFTRVFAGGWSLNSFDEKVSELCADYCIPYVSWKQCTYMTHWADYSGAGGVYSHPDNAESYIQMGDYIAGRVSQYFRG